MQTTLSIDDNTFANLVADKLADRLAPTLVNRAIADKMVTKEFLRKEVFHAGDNINKILRMPGFPSAELDCYNTPRYSVLAVNKWIADQQQYR